MDRMIAIVALVVSIGSVGITWVLGRRNIKIVDETKTETAKQTAIEEARRREELTPQFNVTGKGTGEDRAVLRIELTGPEGLDYLDEVMITVRNDTHTRGESQIAGGPSAAEIAKVVWGPYRLVPGVDDATLDGRKVIVSEKLFRGDWLPLALERTLAPYWMTDPSWWRRDWSGKPVRLLFTCRRGDATWEVPHEVKVKPGPATAISDPALTREQAKTVFRPEGRLNI